MHPLKASQIVTLLIVLFSIPASAFKPTRIFKFKNNCDQTIWVGGFGVPLMPKTGW